jgi:hypothetical protein
VHKAKLPKRLPPQCSTNTQSAAIVIVAQFTDCRNAVDGGEERFALRRQQRISARLERRRREVGGDRRGRNFAAASPGAGIRSGQKEVHQQRQ